MTPVTFDRNFMYVGLSQRIGQSMMYTQPAWKLQTRGASRSARSNSIRSLSICTREMRGVRSVLFANLVDHMVVATFCDQNLELQ